MLLTTVSGDTLRSILEPPLLHAQAYSTLVSDNVLAASQFDVAPPLSSLAAAPFTLALPELAATGAAAGRSEPVLSVTSADDYKAALSSTSVQRSVVLPLTICGDAASETAFGCVVTLEAGPQYHPIVGVNVPVLQPGAAAQISLRILPRDPTPVPLTALAEFSDCHGRAFVGPIHDPPPLRIDHLLTPAPLADSSAANSIWVHLWAELAEARPAPADAMVTVLSVPAEHIRARLARYMVAPGRAMALLPPAAHVLWRLDAAESVPDGLPATIHVATSNFRVLPFVAAFLADS
jgi:hypothetical protein